MKRHPVPLHKIVIENVRCRVTNADEGRSSGRGRFGSLHVATCGLTFYSTGRFRRLLITTVERDDINGVVTSWHSALRTHGFLSFHAGSFRYEFRTPRPRDAKMARMLLCSGLYSSRRR